MNCFSKQCQLCEQQECTERQFVITENACDSCQRVRTWACGACRNNSHYVQILELPKTEGDDYENFLSCSVAYI